MRLPGLILLILAAVFPVPQAHADGFVKKVLGAGSPAVAASGCGAHPGAIAFHPKTKELYFVDDFSRICRLTQGGNIQVVAGNGRAEPLRDGPALDVNIAPYAIAFKPKTRELFFTNGDSRISKVSDGEVITVIGGGVHGLHWFNRHHPGHRTGIAPFALAFHPITRELFFSDGAKVKKLDAEETSVTTVAGTGKRGFSDDWDPLETNLSPIALAVEPSIDQVLVAEPNHIRRLSVDRDHGFVVTVAGNGKTKYGRDGHALAVAVNPVALAFDRAKNRVYFTDHQGRIRLLRGEWHLEHFGHEVETLSEPMVFQAAGDPWRKINLKPRWLAVSPFSHDPERAELYVSGDLRNIWRFTEAHLSYD